MLRVVCLLGTMTLMMAGCFAGEEGPGRTTTTGPDLTDLPIQTVQDTYYDVQGGDAYPEHMANYLAAGALGGNVRYHTWEEVEEKLEAWERDHPHLVERRVIGHSHQGRAVWDIVITDKAVTGGKIKPLLDGGHHGNEYGGSEIMLYTGDLLLENWATNQTIRDLLQRVEVHIVPVVNPDGYAAGTRHNAQGVNLNRNYDVDWGNPFGTSNPVMGEAGATLGRPMSGAALVAENCGAHAFSEPETQAVRDLMASFGDSAAFYLSGHTPTHAVIAPPAAFDPPFEVPHDHRGVLDEELEWIRTNTEYEAGRAQWGDLSAGLPYAASGSSMDYYYHTLGKPAFTVEVEYFVTSATAEDYPFRLSGAFEGLRYWMDATLPLPMHLLANAERLHAWEAPIEPPLLPHDFTLNPVPDRPVEAWPYLH